MTAMEKNPGRIKSFFKDPIIAYAGVTVFCCRINNKNGLAARNLRGQKLRKRARQHPASDQIIDGEVADHHRRRGPDDRRNHRCEAAPVRELRIEQRVVFIEFLPSLLATTSRPVRNRAGSNSMVGSCRRISSRSYHHVESGLPMISLTLSSSKSGSMGEEMVGPIQSSCVLHT